MNAPHGFHAGELAVQERAGVRAAAARLSGMLAPPDLSGGARRFLGGRDFAVLAARAGGRLWASPLWGEPGFLDAAGTTLRVGALPAPADPLAVLPTGPAGLIVIDFAARRRMRVNGTVTAVDAGGFELAVDQAYGNCPQYISPRRLDHRPAATVARRGSRLDADQVRLIERADTFFLGTAHPDGGVDASHRGGAAGFLHVDGDTLWWPDYPGNNMFNSLGNLAVDPVAALLVPDFATGAALHLSGTAAVEWFTPDDRRVVFTTQQIIDVAGTGGPRAG